jgi:hypothetical protein
MRHRGNAHDDDDDDNNKTLWRHFLPIIKMSQEKQHLRMCNKCWNFKAKHLINNSFSLYFIIIFILILEIYLMHHFLTN